MDDWYRYLTPSDTIVSFSWNADTVCVPCVVERLNATLIDEAVPSGAVNERQVEEAGIEELRALYCTLILERPESTMGDLDTSEMPQPVFAGNEGAYEDSCGSCLKRIEDTL